MKVRAFFGLQNTIQNPGLDMPLTDNSGSIIAAVFFPQSKEKRLGLLIITPFKD